MTEETHHSIPDILRVCVVWNPLGFLFHTLSNKLPAFMLGVGGGRGGGAGGFRGGGAHYGPVRGGARGGGGRRRPPPASFNFTVRIMLEDASVFGRVIGAGGSIVKQTQRETGTNIRLPRRDAPPGSPTLVSGPTPFSVLAACHKIANQALNSAAADAEGCKCMCDVGDNVSIRAMLHRAAGDPFLFAATGSSSDDSSAADHDSAASSDEASAFAAVALMVGPLAPSPDIETIAPLLDDVAFGVGLSSGALNAAVAEPSQSLKTFYIYAIGRSAVDALSSTTLPLLCERLSAQPPPPPPPGRQYVPAPADGPTAQALRTSTERYDPMDDDGVGHEV